MAVRFDIITIFPGMFSSAMGESIVGRAVKSGLAEINCVDLRDFTEDRYRSIDDRPYGGGPGMVFKPEPVFDAVESVLSEVEPLADGRVRKIILTPQGRRLDQPLMRELSTETRIVLLCGHYEGFDERIIEGLDFEEVSIGDYVLSGGELPAMVLVDGIVRLIPGALGHPESSSQESFENGVLDYPQYTRPPEYRGLKVPDVLLSGNHAEIEQWRRQQSLERTRERRGDLLENKELQETGQEHDKT